MKQVKLSRRMAGLEESATLALNARVKKLAAEGKPVFNLTAGELDGPTPKFIQKVVGGKLDQNKYTPVPGLPGLRQAIAEYESRRLGHNFEASNVVVTAGVKTGLYALLQVMLDRGDEVILPIPAWVSYAHMINLAGGKVIKVPLKPDNNLDADAVVSKISKRTNLIMLNSPSNPTGAVFSKSELGRLAKAIKGKPIMVMSDDIYSTLTYGAQFYSIANAGLPLEQLVIVNGFSKSQVLTGWRIGYVLAPDFIAEALSGFLSHASGNAPLHSQYAAEAALARGNQPAMLRTLESNRKLVISRLNKISNVEFTPPGGAFYFWLDIRKLTKNSAAWCERLLDETGVALVPGEAFFAPGFARLSFAADKTVLKPALDRLAQFVNNS